MAVSGDWALTGARGQGHGELLERSAILLKMRGRGLPEGWPCRGVAPFLAARARPSPNPRARPRDLSPIGLRCKFRSPIFEAPFTHVPLRARGRKRAPLPRSPSSHLREPVSCFPASFFYRARRRAALRSHPVGRNLGGVRKGNAAI